MTTTDKHAALDKAILEHRANPSPATHAALLRAGEVFVDRTYAEDTIGYQRRTHA